MKKLFKKYKEIITYIIFGILTTVVNFLAYTLADKLAMSIIADDILRASVCNVFAWILAVAFAFVTNKLWVFNSKSWEIKLVLKELGTFVAARILTGLFEWILLPLLMSWGLNQTILGITGGWAKVITSVFVIITNYILSKFIIFRKKKKTRNDESGENDKGETDNEK